MLVLVDSMCVIRKCKRPDRKKSAVINVENETAVADRSVVLQLHYHFHFGSEKLLPRNLHFNPSNYKFRADMKRQPLIKFHMSMGIFFIGATLIFFGITAIKTAPGNINLKCIAFIVLASA